MGFWEDLIFGKEYRIARNSEKLLEHTNQVHTDNEVIKKILIENMLDSIKNSDEIKKEINTLNDKIDRIEKILLEILNK